MRQWRFIFTGANDAFFNMALDEAILRSCRSGSAIPTLRLYLWKPPGISIGYFQSLEKTVDLKRCKESKIHVVRRITGGRAVLHENEITYSLCARTAECEELGHNTTETNQKISWALLESLKALKISPEWVRPKRERISSTENLFFSKPCFISISRYEIAVGGKKLIGSAQRRDKESFLQHGSIPLENGRFNIVDLLSPGPAGSEGLKRRMREKLEEKSTNLEKTLKRKVGYQEVISGIKEGFSRFFDVAMMEAEPDQRESQMAQVLRRKKYATAKWNLGRSHL